MRPTVHICAQLRQLARFVDIEKAKGRAKNEKRIDKTDEGERAAKEKKKKGKK